MSERQANTYIRNNCSQGWKRRKSSVKLRFQILELESGNIIGTRVKKC